MSSVLIYQPVGLGDYLVCSGIVREYAKKHDRVGLLCLEPSYISISFLYRDVPHVQVISIRSHKDANRLQFLNRFRLSSPHYDRVLKVGVLDEESGIQYETQFYQSAGLPIEALWDNFYLERDEGAEKNILDRTNVPERYIFVHDDARFRLQPEHLPSFPVFRPDPALTKNIFDYCLLIEKAQEIHVMDSSFMFLVDCLDYSAPDQKLFVHRYARPNMPWNLPILKKPWTILE